MPQISAVFHQASSDTWRRSAGRSVGEIIPTTVPSSPTTTSVRPARRINSATSARGILSGTTSPGSTAFIAPATSPSPLRPVTRPTTPPEDTTGTAPALPSTDAIAADSLTAGGAGGITATAVLRSTGRAAQARTATTTPTGTATRKDGLPAA